MAENKFTTENLEKLKSSLITALTLARSVDKNSDFKFEAEEIANATVEGLPKGSRIHVAIDKIRAWDGREGQSKAEYNEAKNYISKLAETKTDVLYRMIKVRSVALFAAFQIQENEAAEAKALSEKDRRNDASERATTLADLEKQFPREVTNDPRFQAMLKQADALDKTEAPDPNKALKKEILGLGMQLLPYTKYIDSLKAPDENDFAKALGIQLKSPKPDPAQTR